jgi:hypothetical protein
MTNQIATLSECKAYLGLGTNATLDDALITSIGDAVLDFMQTYTGRKILQDTYTETLNGRGESGIPVKNTPITGISSLLIDGLAIQSASNSYSYGYAFDDFFVYLRGYKFSRGQQNIQITYTGGYNPVPNDWKQAHIEFVAYKYKQKDRIGVTNITTGGITTTAYIKSDVPPEVQIVMDRYRTVTV